MSEVAVRLLAALLGAVFAWSAVAKLLHMEAWKSALARYRLPAPVERAARGLVPAVELVVPVLILVGSMRAAAALVLVLVGVFSLAVLRARSLEGDRLPCGCFGKTKARDYRLMLVRNSVLAVMASALLLGADDVPLFEGIGAPDGSEILPVVLVLVGLVAVAWIAWSAGSSFRKGQS